MTTKKFTPIDTEDSAVIAVVDAAKTWWEGKRPVSFGVKEHLLHHTVNCANDYEKALATVVANMVRMGW